MTIAFQIIGPTGVGKSYWGEKLTQSLNLSDKGSFIFKDLDAEIPNVLETFRKQGPEAFLKLSLEILTYLHQQKENMYIVAIGSGTQWSACYLNRAHKLLNHPTGTLWATPEWTLRNLKSHRQDLRSLPELVKTEYTPQHQRMYSAVRCIDRTRLSSEQLLLQLRKAYGNFR